jgi:uncharacterized protein YbjT (DUF2867 family)
MILLTGVTGKTGGATAQALLARGVKFRALVRNAEKAAPLAAAGAELVTGDVADPAVLARALAGVEKALLLVPNGEQQLGLETQFTDAAKRAGVNHLVKLSSIEATATTKVPIAAIHYAAEQYIEQSGLAWTFVKPSFFMQNFLANAGTIKEQGKFFLPMGTGQVATIDCADIGAAIAAVLTTPGHAGKRYELTGPEVLDFGAIAARMSSVLGRPVQYVDVPPAAYRGTLARFLTNEWHLNAVMALFGEIAACHDAYTTDTVQRLTGRAPASIDDFVARHRAVFTG